MKSHIASIVLLAWAASAPALAQRVPDVRISTNGYSGAWTRLAAWGDSVYAVWEEGTIVFNRSLDRGATWLSSGVKLGSTSTQDPDVAAWGSSAYVVWHTWRPPWWGSDIYFNYSSNGGATWQSADVRLSTNPSGTSTSTTPQIAASGSYVYAVWEDTPFDSPNWYIGADIRLNASADGGATWLPQDVRLNTRIGGLGFGRDPKIAAAGSSVYVSWMDGRGPRWDVYFNRSVDGGASWLSRDVRLNPSVTGSSSAWYPEIAQSGTSVYVTWSDGRNGKDDIYLNYSKDRGATWLSSAVRLDTDPAGAASSWKPELAVSGASVFVTWGDKRNGMNDIYLNYSSDGGVTWLSSDVRLDTDPAGAASSGLPRIAVSGGGVFVTWMDYRNSQQQYAQQDIYFNRSLDGGATWLSRDVRLDTDPPGAATSLFPDIAASGPAVYVAWQDSRGRGRHTYFNVPFGALSYGAAKKGSGGVAPLLAATGAPTLGSSVAIDVQQGLGGAAGALWIGAGPASKTAVEFAGSTLWVQPALALPIALGGPSGVSGGGAASFPLTIPSLPAVVGANLNFQAVFLDSGATFGLSMTNGLEMWIG